ncbi:MAG: class I SAM-dependent methyltransferase [Pirellulales bacterium]|nr:class I SAM-dependent methyltransferase [Pirellulales bacterium]
MRIRESGMPAEDYWESLFDVGLILGRLGIGRFEDVAELGCGYGTFSLPVAQAIGGTLYTFDIDPAMLARTRQRTAGLRVVCDERDVVQRGFGVQVDAVLLFNILHCEEPVRLLEHATAALRDGGQVFVIHWRHGDTPRGPSLDIRPRPEQIIGWAAVAGLQPTCEIIDLPPWHYGLRLGKCEPTVTATVSSPTKGLH